MFAAYFEFIGFAGFEPDAATVFIAAFGVQDGAVFPESFGEGEVFDDEHTDEGFVLFRAGAFFAFNIGFSLEEFSNFAIELAIFFINLDVRFGFARLVVNGFPSADGGGLGKDDAGIKKC